MIALLGSIAAPALAQNAPPVRHNVDDNGVDVVLGRFEFSQKVISIGPEWPHGLHFTRMRVGDVWANNLSGDIDQNGADLFVAVGNTSAKFTYSGGFNLYNPGTFSSELGDGSTLTRSGGLFTYTNRDGVIARFTAAISSLGRIVAGTGRIIDIRYPNGSLVTFNYRTENLCDEQGLNCTAYFRLQSATNNFNYQIHFAYAQNDLTDPADAEAWTRMVSVRAINTAVEPCDPYADQCTLMQSWPTVGFAASPTEETVTLPDNSIWRFIPDGFGRLGGIRRPGSSANDVSIGYDIAGRVQAVTGTAGAWTYSYVDNGATRTTTAQGPLGTGWVVTSDPAREIVLSSQDALGQSTGYQYDGQERVTRITFPEGNYVQYSYDARGNVTEVRRVAKPDSGLADIVTTAAYPATCSTLVTCNQPQSTTDARGNKTDFTYDSVHGGVLTQTVPAPVPGAIRPQVRVGYMSASVGGQTVYLPNRIGSCQTLASCTGAADEAVTTIAYSGANFLPSSLTRGNGSGSLTSTSTVVYDNIGNVLTEDGPLPGAADTTRLRHNALRQVTGAISPDPDGAGGNPHRAERTTYDAAGLVQAVEIGTVTSQSDAAWGSFIPLQRIEIGRNALGRPTSERLMSGGTTYALTQTSYDAAGRTRCSAQRMNPALFASPPSDACSVGAEGSFGPDRVVRTSYDVLSRPNQVETGVGTPAAAVEAASTFTPNGELETLTDGANNRTTYLYDGHDRLSRTHFPVASQGANQSSTTDYEELSYDASSNVTSLRNRAGQIIAFTYDALNRPTFKNLPGAEPDVTYAYDLLSRLISANQAGNSVGFAYDALGRTTGQTGSHGTLTSTFDAADRRTRLDYPGGFFVTYDYHLTGEMTRIRESGTTDLATFAYDDRGRRTSLTYGNGATTTYGYDAVSRLTSLVTNLAGTANDLTLGFTHNPASQIVTNTRSNDAYSFTGLANANRTDTHNGLNQIATSGGTTLTHDARGNVTNDGVRTYGYSSENLLTSAGGVGAFTYDPLMRLVQSSGSGARFAYDGAAIAEEYNGSGVRIGRYVHGPSMDEPLVWYDGSNTRRYLQADERGSIVSTSTDANAVWNIASYDDYGQPGQWNYGRFGYTGQAWLPEVGLLYYRARIYAPHLGRFMQPDPIGYEGGVNLYAYVGNDPINFVDPWGLQQHEEDEVIVQGWLFAGLGGGGGRGGGGMMVAGPTISETGENVVVVTANLGDRRRRRGGLLQSVICLLAICADSEIRVYRVVGPVELASILLTGEYTMLPEHNVKGFYLSYSQAFENAQLFARFFQLPQTITSTTFPFSQLPPITHVAREGPAYFMPSSAFPHGPVTIYVTVSPPGR